MTTLETLNNLVTATAEAITANKTAVKAAKAAAKALDDRYETAYELWYESILPEETDPTYAAAKAAEDALRTNMEGLEKLRDEMNYQVDELEAREEDLKNQLDNAKDTMKKYQRLIAA